MATIAKAGNPSLSTVTPCNASRVVCDAPVGEDVKAGDVCYVKSDGTVWRSNGTASNAAARADGIAAGNANVASGDTITLYRGVNFAYGSGLTPGARYYVSATPGALDDAATTGGVNPVAFAIDGTRIRFLGSNY